MLLTKYCSDDKAKKKEMHGACSTYGEEESCRQVYGWAYLRERAHLERLGYIGE